MRMYFFVVALSLIAGGHSFADETSTWLTHVRAGVRPTMILEMNPERCALLIVDIQAMTMTDVATKNIEMSADDREFHRRRMHGTVLPNLNTLVTFFREKQLPVVYICLGSEPPYRDLPAPLPSEKVLNKPRTGAFAGTDLHAYLQAKGVTTLFVSGTGTSACALFTGYGACDRSYQLVLVEDASLSVLPQTHEDTVGVWGLFATIQNTRRILAEYPWQGWIDRRDPTPALMCESIRKNILNLADPKEELRAFKFCTQNLLSNYSRGKISEAEFTKLWYGLDALARKYYYEALTEKMQSATFKTKFANPAR